MRFFVQQEYHNKPAFSGFLPGIAGVHGIPMWVFYVNRGQGVIGFGVESKDGCIGEYNSALKAYHLVREQGFRTFVRITSGAETVLWEPFQGDRSDGNHGKNEFRVATDELVIVDENPRRGVRVEIHYRTLAEAPVAALVREVTFTNTGGEEIQFEFLDGLPFLVPAGVDYKALSTIVTTAQGWMKAIPLEDLGVLYRVGASMQDSAAVEEQKTNNFAVGLRRDGETLSGMQPIYDPDILFPPQQFFSAPRYFTETGLQGLRYDDQIREGKQHCAFFGDAVSLAPGGTYTLTELYGGAAPEDTLIDFLSWFRNETNSAALQDEGRQVIERIVANCRVRTANPLFDGYCEQNFLDNVLRGGFPHMEGSTCIPVFSRKHGDLERDYNWFVIPPEYYSQGWGNYRDVNQNRRSDIFFVPESGKEHIREFVSLIQTDGYNPLVVQGRSFRLPDPDRAPDPDLAAGFSWVSLPEAHGVVSAGSYSPGSLYAALRSDIGPDNASELAVVFGRILDASEVEYNALHGEGFWIDHWTYNNDLIENYHAVFPERTEALFWAEREYPYFTSGHRVLPREKKWQATAVGVRQYLSVEEPETPPPSSWMVDSRGAVYLATLGEKLLGVAALKFLGRDAFGIGMEMEAGKPGWYDALNGLPGILSSSLPESWELLRLIRLLLTLALHPAGPTAVSLAEEICDLYTEIPDLIEPPEAGDRGLHLRWDRMTRCREDYREKTAEGFTGTRRSMGVAELRAVLEAMENDVVAGLELAQRMNNGVLPCYLVVQPVVTGAPVTDDSIANPAILDMGVPDFSCVPLPLFLEGFARALPLQATIQARQAMHRQVMASELYDHKLSMVRVNAPLDALSHEIGRARAFTPGWLENGSIWMHMQYKYLLALLHGGLYAEFWQLARTMLVPFMDPEVYGRSPLENSSFIVSSLHPDSSLHGRGFVARLSGSTAEFISILQLCLWGRRPFRYHRQQLQLHFDPCLPDDLFNENREISSLFLGSVSVTYRHRSSGDVYPGSGVGITGITVVGNDGSREVIPGAVLSDSRARAVRDGQVRELIIELDQSGGAQ